MRTRTRTAVRTILALAIITAAIYTIHLWITYENMKTYNSCMIHAQTDTMRRMCDYAFR